MTHKGKKILFFILLVVLLAIAGVSAFFVIRYGMESDKQQDRFDDLAAIVESIQAETETGPAVESQPEDSILPEYEPLHLRNTHMVGWICIDGTDINYPVMQTPEAPDYYLHRNFDREYSGHGCIYVREDCDLNTPSDNVTIYGHHMKDGSMFADLDEYINPQFREAHRFIQFDTLTEHHMYEVFAVFITTATVGEGFEYHSFVNAGTEEDFDWFVQQCKSLALYDTGITPEYGDKVICLSTCEYTQENGRLVVAAVRVESERNP